MPLEVGQFILPFSVLSEDRREPFTKEMEKAAIFCFAELERIKGGGLILKQPAEKPAFIAEICYPFWRIPWGESSLLFDGLNTTAYTLTYKIIPNVKAFMEDLERSSKTLETYMAFLSSNVNYFRAFNNEKEMVIDGLITDPNLLNDFNLYLSEATQVKAPLSDMVVLSPTIDELTISSIKQELESLNSEFKEEVNILYRSMKILNTTTGNFIEAIRSKIKAIEEEFSKEIKRYESFITQKVDRIRKEFDERITKLSKNFEEQLFRLHRGKIMFKKSKEQTLGRIEQYRVEVKTCVVNKDVVGERKWKEAIHECKKKLPVLEAKIKELNVKIKEINDKKSLEIFELRSEHETKIKEAKKDLLEIEASRDAKIQIHEQEMEQLEELTSTIIEQIDKMAKLKEAALAEFEKLGIQQKHRKRALIYMPFYLVCYQSESKKRYVHFPPSVVSSIGFSVKLKGALGKAKISQLLVPRFKTIVSLLNKFPPLIEQNAVFEREINEAGAKADILKTKFMSELVKNGLKRLKIEGWFSEKEYEVLNQKLALATVGKTFNFERSIYPRES